MKIAAAHALARYVENPTSESILPSPLDKNVPKVIAAAVKLRAISEGVARVIE
jgi:malate dehydrogenase (oxaloacetate-decarboxylating)